MGGASKSGCSRSHHHRRQQSLQKTQSKTPVASSLAPACTITSVSKSAVSMSTLSRQFSPTRILPLLNIQESRKCLDIVDSQDSPHLPIRDHKTSAKAGKLS